jgi:hypothetical protein
VNRFFGPLVGGGLVAALVGGRALVAQPAPADTALRRVLCVADAATGAPVTGPIVEAALPNGRWRAIARQRTSIAAGCVIASLPRDAQWRVRRLGYAPTVGERSPDGLAHDTIRLVLRPIAALLAPAITRERSTTSAPNAVTLDASSARAHGAGSTGALIALLPFVQPRSVRGDVTVSLRGTRREQVAVTLDGVPLTDPATGIADLADVPLGIIGGATVAPGADPLGAGPGAIGGVLALHTASGGYASARVGAFGATLLEGARDVALGGGQLRLGASHQQAQNDFPFRNTASTTGLVLDERRVNNDVRRDALFAQWRDSRVQLVALASRTAQGMVGPVNVRAYDADRARASRLFVRGAADVRGVQLTTSMRAFGLDYRDPARRAFDSDADVLAFDVDAQQVVRGVRWHLGAGGDRLRATGDVAQARARAHGALTHRVTARGLMLTSGARVDVVQEHGAQPSFSLGLERPGARATVGARVAQALRVPTLYDLYFASPQRVSVTPLRPERVVFDAEAYARVALGVVGGGALSAQGALVARAARDAIVWFPGNFGWSPANVGRETLRGGELRAAWDTRTAHVSAWGSWYDAELQSGALRVPTPYVARASGGMLARVTRGHVTVAPAMRAFGTRPFTSGPRDPAFALPAVVLLDAAVSLRHTWPAGHTVLTLALENATDRAWQSVRGFPAPGRSWSVTATLSP